MAIRATDVGIGDAENRSVKQGMGLGPANVGARRAGFGAPTRRHDARYAQCGARHRIFNFSPQAMKWQYRLAILLNCICVINL
jgi:hypothetical protein